MSVDNTELTFVRCPGCKKLLPAMSSKCRICGTSLEAKTETPPAQTATSTSSSRIIKYPSATSSESVKEPVSVKSNAKNSAAHAVASANTNGNGAAIHDDPLAHYLDELDAETTIGSGFASSDQSTAVGGFSVPQEDFDEDDDVKEQSQDDTFDDFDDELKALFDEDNENLEEELPNVPEIEPEEEPEVEPVPVSAKFVEPAPLISKPKIKPAAKVEKYEEPLAEEEEQEEEVAPRRRSAPLASNRMVSSRPEVASRPASREVPAADVGKLIGFLINFAEVSSGQAIELRSGKFFITAAKLKKGDLVLDAPSISTPHAMFNIVSQSEVLVQDLMSEKGLFVKKAGAAAFRREEDVTSLSHGDWVRFGDEEYLISLLPEKY